MNSLIVTEIQYQLIPLEGTASEVRLSHASQRAFALGGPLSNTWVTYPKEKDNLGKLRIILHKVKLLQRALPEMLRRLRMGLRGIRLLVR